VCKEDSLREMTLREDWPVVNGSWRHTWTEEFPCELLREHHFLGSGVPAKQLWSRRKGMGAKRERERDGVGEAGRARSVSGMRGGGGQESKVSAGSSPDLSHGTKC
jgi:hypothetical protein